MEFDELEFRRKIEEIENKEHYHIFDLWGCLEGSYFDIEREASIVKLVLNKKTMSRKKDRIFRQIENAFRDSGGQL